MTLTLILFGSNMGLRALNKIFLYRFLYFSYFDDLNSLKTFYLDEILTFHNLFGGKLDLIFTK